MEASLRILRVMVSEDNDSMSDVMDYIGHINAGSVIQVGVSSTI